MIRKNYKASTLTRLFSLGFKRYGVKIISEEIVWGSSFSKRVLIDNIDKISYELRKSGEHSYYFYIITDKREKEFRLRYSLLEGTTYQELLRDLKKMNPKITLSEYLEKFLSDEIKKIEFKFDFTVHKGEIYKRGKEFSQKYPSLDFFLVITCVFIFILITSIFAGIGSYLLTQIFGDSYQSYRLVSILVSGLSFSLAIANIFMSLVSQYLGNKLTIISLAITIIGLCVGFLRIV